MDAPAASGSSHRTAWAGIVFAVLYVLGLMWMGGSQPDNVDDLNDQPVKLAAAWHKYYLDSGHRWGVLVGAFVVCGAVLALVVFGSAIRDRLADAGAPGYGRLAFAGTIMFGTVTLAGTAGVAWIAGAKQFGTVAVPSGELTYLAPQLGFAMLLLGGGTTAALFLFAAGRGAVRTRALPAWLGWAGMVIGVLIFFLAVMFIPMVLVVLWVLIAAIIMLRNPVTA